MTSASTGAPAGATPDPGRGRILRSATRLFFEKGFEGTAVTSIAKASGMTAAAMYWHFPSKVDLLFAVLERLVRDGYDDLAAAVGTGDPVSRLTEYVEAFVGQQMEEAGTRNFGYSSLVASLPSSLQAEMWKLGKPYMDLLREILEQGRESGDFEYSDPVVVAFAIGTMCEYVFTWFRADGPVRENVVAKQYADLVLRMVTKPGRA